MIIFGTGRKVIGGSQQRLPHPCPSCGQSAMVQVVSQSYFHLFFIPTLPTGRSASAHCQHCQRATAVPVPPTPGTPMWAFSGCAVFGVIFAVGVISSAVQQASTKDASAAPPPPVHTHAAPAHVAPKAH
jgi:hypothetical protein